MTSRMKWATVAIVAASCLGAGGSALAVPQDQGGDETARAARTIPVPGGDNAKANGRKLLQAVDGIESPPARPVVLKLGKGTYDLRKKSLVLNSGVSLEGAGEDTRIVAVGGPTNTRATVEIAGPATLSKVTVESRGAPHDHAVAILIRSSHAELSEVKAMGRGAKELNYGIRVDGSGEVELSGVTASATGGSYAYGISFRDSAKAVFTDVEAEASGPGENYGVFVLNEVGLPDMSLELDNVQGLGRSGKASHGLHLGGLAKVEAADSSFEATQADSNFGLSSQGQPLLLLKGESIGRGLKMVRSKVCGKDVGAQGLAARGRSPRAVVECNEGP